MKLKLLPWFLFFFFLFSHLVWRSGANSFSLTHAPSELSENITGKEPEGSNATVGMDKERRGMGAKAAKIVCRKGQKGSGGGVAELSRKPPRTSHSGASTFLPSHYLVIGVVLQVSTGLLLTFHFLF